MKNIFVPYEIAKQLKEKGFNEPCFTKYYESEKLADNLSYIHHNYLGQINAPLYQQVEEWLFKEYNIFIEIKRIKVMADPNDDLHVYYCEIGNFSSDHYKMPKQALRKGIEEALKLIK